MYTSCTYYWFLLFSILPYDYVIVSIYRLAVISRVFSVFAGNE